MSFKVAIVIERYDIALGGAERSTSELSSALTALDIETHIVAAKGQAPAKNIHILCADSPGKRVAYRTFAEALQAHIAENTYDIIHSILPFPFADVYQPRSGIYPESILRNAAACSSPLYATYKRLTAFANFRRAALLRAERKICTGSDGPVLVAISEYMAEQLRKHYRPHEDRIVVIKNGVKTNLEVSQTKADALRAKILAHFNLKEADDPVLFLFVANDFRRKGLESLIRAMHLLLEEDHASPAYLIVAGNDNADRYKRLAKDLHVYKRMLLLGNVTQIQNLIAIIDVALLPTYYDPCSRFVLEALAAGKPVITTRFNGAVDHFTDGRHGKVIDAPENVDALAAAIAHFADAAKVEKAAEAIIADNLKDRISTRRVAEELSTLYESILATKKRV